MNGDTVDPAQVIQRAALLLRFTPIRTGPCMLQRLRTVLWSEASFMTFNRLRPWVAFGTLSKMRLRSCSASLSVFGLLQPLGFFPDLASHDAVAGNSNGSQAGFFP